MRPYYFKLPLLPVPYLFELTLSSERDDSHGLFQVFWSQVRVSLGHLKGSVPKELLEVVKAASVHHEVTRIGVSQIMEADLVFDSSSLLGCLKVPVDMIHVQRVSFFIRKDEFPNPQIGARQRILPTLSGLFFAQNHISRFYLPSAEGFLS
jgi:hypothetical protein